MISDETLPPGITILRQSVVNDYSTLPLKIFVVDDDCDDTDILRQVLKEFNQDFKIWCFDNPETAYYYLDALSNKELPSLIIIDFKMPLLNGLDMLNKLKETSRFDGIPKIIYSSHLNANDINECRKAGAIDCITKSSTIEGTRNDAKKILSYFK